MNTILKSFEEAFREMISERITQRMKADVDKCLITDAKANFKIYEQKEKLEVLVHSGKTAEFNTLFCRLSSMADDKKTSLSEVMHLQGVKDGFSLNIIYLQGMQDKVRLHTLIMLDEKGA